MNTKFEFAGIIPSVNETKFDEPVVEDETFGIVNTFEEWKEWKISMINDRYNSGYNHDFGMLYTSFIDDIDGVKYLSKQMNLGGFMIAPTALLNGKLITATTRRLMQYEFFNDFIDQFSNNAPNIYLYDLVFCPVMPNYKQFCSSTGEAQLISPSFDGAGHWKVRFGIVE